MNKKLIGVSLALMLTASVALTGCGGAKAEDPVADGVLKIGTNDTYVPLEYRDENNEMVGFDIDLGNAIAEDMGVKPEWISTAWDGIFNGLNANQYDVIISGTSITPERVEGFSMSDPYITNGIVIVSRNDGTPAKAPKDLAGKKVGVQIETTADYAAEALKKSEGIEFEINKFDAMMDGFAALEGKSIDYIMTDQPVGQFYTKLKPNVYSVTSDILSNEPIGVTMRKGDAEFAKKMNETLKKLKDNGKMVELSMKWFGKDVTQNISTELKIIE
ncbi:MAG: ABC transporter substrate-binding protein [Eubacterium sp.]